MWRASFADEQGKRNPDFPEIPTRMTIQKVGEGRTRMTILSQFPSAEVERVLNQHPSIAAAAVVGRPDAKWQEVPVACIVLRGPASPAAAPTAAVPHATARTRARS